MENIKVRERTNTFIEIDKLAPDKDKYWQIDFLKVFAIALVLMDHSTTHEGLFQLASPLWERIAIPLFMIVLGFNWAKSLEKRKTEPLYKLYSWNNYFKSKLLRFVLPFAIIYGLSLIFYVILIPVPNEYLMDIGIYAAWPLRLLLPVWGPGDWFIPALFLTILIFPLIYWAFARQPVMALIGCYILEIFYQLFIYNMLVQYITQHPEWNINVIYMYLVSTPFVLLSAIGLGIWLSQDHRWDSPRNIFIYIFGILSFIYLWFYTFDRTPLNPIFYPYRIFEWINGDYNLFVYPWSALIVFFALNTLPKEPYGRNYRFISLLSSSTYHILMVQMFYFSIIYNLFLPLFGGLWSAIGGQYAWVNYLWYYPVNVAITFTLGTLWYKFEKEKIWDRRQRIAKKQYELLKTKGWIQ